MNATRTGRRAAMTGAAAGLAAAALPAAAQTRRNGAAPAASHASDWRASGR